MIKFNFDNRLYLDDNHYPDPLNCVPSVLNFIENNMYEGHLIGNVDGGYPVEYHVEGGTLCAKCATKILGSSYKEPITGYCVLYGELSACDDCGEIICEGESE